jgi:hypothetical protein
MESGSNHNPLAAESPMNKKSRTKHPFLTSLLTAMALCSASTGCGQGELENYDSVVQGLYNTVGPVGLNGGTYEGPGSNQTTPVKKIIAYASSSYLYGLKLYWTNSESGSKMYGSENGLEGDELDFTGDSVKEIKYHIDASGVLRGIRFRTVSGTIYPVGYLGNYQTTAFSGKSAFTDLGTYKGTISSTTTIWGATFYYISTAP